MDWRRIGKGAFFGCYGITWAIIPDSVHRIGWYAFLCAKVPVEVRLPEGLKSIGRMDSSSIALESIDISAGV